LKTADVRQTLEKCSCEAEIQEEVDSLFSGFGDDHSKSLWGQVFVNDTEPGSIWQSPEQQPDLGYGAESL